MPLNHLKNQRALHPVAITRYFISHFTLITILSTGDGNEESKSFNMRAIQICAHSTLRSLSSLSVDRKFNNKFEAMFKAYQTEVEAE